MAITLITGALAGVDAVPIEVEVDLLRRLPRVCIVGLADHAVKESAERVRSAIESAGLEFPRKRIVVNLAPADVRKEGTTFDLPVALAILAAEKLVPEERVKSVLSVGELGLGGALRPMRGALSMALLAREMRRPLLLPAASAAEARLVPGADVLGAPTLEAAIRWLSGMADLPPVPDPIVDPPADVDLADVRGQHGARQALEVAAAGGHHVLMVGPPGCGKSMLARRLSTILPPLDFEESLEITRVHAAAGLLDAPRLSGRPFRAPHHTVTPAGMIGDRTLRPGEVSLAHHGVLFLDEAPEFTRSCLELLREPLEDGRIQITRAAGTVEYPAALCLVMAANPCPCGYRGSDRPCRCGDSEVRRYQHRLSGPILDRIDLAIEMTAVPSAELLRSGPGESSAAVRERVVAARQRQRARGQPVCNARLLPREMAEVAPLCGEGRALITGAGVHQGLSGRAVHRVIKVARTLADLDGEKAVAPDHVALALSFRPRWGDT